MGIFTPGKDGDAMSGGYAYQRMGRKQRREFAETKRMQEEKQLSQDYYSSQRMSKKFRETIEKQKKAIGLK